MSHFVQVSLASSNDKQPTVNVSQFNGTGWRWLFMASHKGTPFQVTFNHGGKHHIVGFIINRSNNRTMQAIDWPTALPFPRTGKINQLTLEVTRVIRIQ